MAVSRHVEDSTWVAVWKNQEDAAQGKLGINSQNPVRISVDFSECREVSRLLWPIPQPNDAGSPNFSGPLSIELKATLANSEPSNSVEWIALVQGRSAEHVAFFRRPEKLMANGSADRSLNWSVSGKEITSASDGLFLCFQFYPKAKPIEVMFEWAWREHRAATKIGLGEPIPKPRPAGNSVVSAKLPLNIASNSPVLAQAQFGEGPVPAERLRAISDSLASLSPEHLIAAWNKLEELVVLRRAKAWHKERNWPELMQLGQALGSQQPHRLEMLTLLGRAQIYAQETAGAAKLLGRLAEDCPGDAEANFYAAVAFGRQNDNQQAVGFIRRAVALRPNSGQFWSEQAAILRRLGNEKEDRQAREEILAECVDCWINAMKFDPKSAEKGRIRLAQVYFDLGRMEQALTQVDQALVAAPGTVDILMLRGKVLLAMNRVKEALEVAEQVCVIDPGHQGARFHLRALRNLAEDDGEGPPVSLCVVTIAPETGVMECVTYTLDGNDLRSTPIAPEFAAETDLTRFLGVLQSEWLLFEPLQDEEDLAKWMVQFQSQVPRWCGRVLGQTSSGATVEMWRRDMVQGFVDSGLIESVASMSGQLVELCAVVATVDLRIPEAWSAVGATAVSGQPQDGLVIAMSKHGIVKFGGGEQFLDSMAEHYQDMGYRVIVAGTRPEMIGQTGHENGREFAFVDESPATLRRYFIETRPALVHALSGLGFQVAAALDYLNIPFVYGVHYWRDCLGLTDDDPKFFENFDRDPIPKPAFRYVLQRAATVYSNSEYTREILEQAFQCRTPILYSLPRDVDPALHASREVEAETLLGDARDFVLLVNAKGDKGFDLLLQTAKLCPEIPFLAIASQSDLSEAQTAIDQLGLTNFQIVPRTDRIELLYQRSRVVAVPSYRFVETFSRVCIEAQRFSKPVLGSDRGNVPYLLNRSGVVLPEDANAWAAELRRIYFDADYHAELVAKADVNSTRYDYSSQRKAVHGVVSTLGSQVLVGIGSGIGNMLHAGPMVRNIARRLGRKVDIVVAEDHRNSLFLLHHRDYVNASFSLRQNLLRKRYDVAFLTHCFGDAPVQLHARQVISSRSWTKFEPGGPHHETIFNLEAAQRLLGITYDPADVMEYYVGDYNYIPPVRGRRIGLHGGSKEGFWTSKRWPDYKDLAQALIQRGYEVASFGIEAEYVEGTLDLTGGTISEMIDQMVGCSYFISNDSGLMNIANALGIPLTALFGPTNPATRGPLKPSSSWLSIAKDCSPCEITKSGKATFLAGECRCIAELPFDRVLNHVLAEMERHGLPAEAHGRFRRPIEDAVGSGSFLPNTISAADFNTSSLRQ